MTKASTNLKFIRNMVNPHECDPSLPPPQLLVCSTLVPLYETTSNNSKPTKVLDPLSSQL